VQFAMKQLFQRQPEIGAPTSLRLSFRGGAIQQAAVVLAALALVTCVIFVPDAVTFDNIMQVLRQVAVTGLIALGVTFVVICGRLDLSVGSLLSLCAVTAVVAHNAYGTVAAAIAAVAVGLVVGCINGVLVAVLRLNSLIATLGMLSVLRGVTLVYTGGQNAQIDHPQTTPFGVIGRGHLFGVPVPIFVLAVFAVVLGIVLSRTTFGRRVFTVGGNEIASRFSGVNPTTTLFASYVLSGAMTAVAAIVFASRVMAARNDSGTGYEIAVLSGIILGGTSLIGGSGGIGRTIIGIVILGFVQNTLLLIGLPYFTQWLVTWVVIIVAVWSDVAGKRGRIFA
jgi:ribose transport system permease protein